MEKLINKDGFSWLLDLMVITSLVIRPSFLGGLFVSLE